MDDDRLRDPPYSWHDRAHLTHVTTIVGHVQLLRRWVMRAECLSPGDRERVLRHITAIEQAGWGLHQKPQPPNPPTSET